MLCSRGYDVLLLANSGADATGLEISETAVSLQGPSHVLWL